MKKIRLFLFLLLTVSVAFAQKEKTPKIEKAKIILNEQILSDFVFVGKPVDNLLLFFIYFQNYLKLLLSTYVLDSLCYTEKKISTHTN